MDIYLLRHAMAVAKGTPGYVNDDRPLTEEGREKMKKAARGIARLVAEVDLIVTSPLLRTHDTAKIVAETLSIPEEKIELCKHLLPGGSTKNLLTFLAQHQRRTKKVVLVGHEPDLGHLAATLLNGDEEMIEFKKGSLCHIETEGPPHKGSGKLRGLYPPRALRLMARARK